MNEYLERFNRISNNTYQELETYAKENSVPIIQYESLINLLTILKVKNPSRILEVGTAIGYSALKMSDINDHVIIDTIERDEKMYKAALENISLYNKEKRINVFYSDALNIDLNLLSQYDVIFIDAAKAQYQKFFDLFVPLLKEDGIVITDNILFHGCVEDMLNNKTLSKNVTHLAKKIDVYNNFLIENSLFETYFLNSGDGLAVTFRRKHE